MDQPPRIPTFGVPQKISSKDVLFVVVAGIGLTIVFFGFVAGFGVKNLDRDNPLHVLLVLSTIGLGPASAYYLARWLRANRIALPVGCGALVLWAILLVIGALFGGWFGVAILLVVTGVVMARVHFRQGLREPADADLHQ